MPPYSIRMRPLVRALALQVTIPTRTICCGSPSSPIPVACARGLYVRPAFLRMFNPILRRITEASTMVESFVFGRFQAEGGAGHLACSPQAGGSCGGLRRLLSM
jgi:hypothetical protein